MTITVPKPTGTYTSYAGVNYGLDLPAGAEISSVAYNLPMGNQPFEPQRDSGGTYWFSNTDKSNIFKEDMACTVNIT